MPAHSPLGRALERSYGDTPVGLAELMEEIQRQAGSGRKAAKMVGVGETTWRRWKSGNTKPKAANLAKAVVAVRSVRAANKRLTADGLRFKMTDRHDGRQRTLTGRQLGLRPADVQAVENAYISDGPDEAAKALVRHIRDSFYRSYFDGTEAHDGVAEYGEAEYGGTVGSASW